MKWKLLPFAVAVVMAWGAHAADTLADAHAEMNDGCESCHVNDGEPSADAVVENEQCAMCHGAAEELDGEHHALHAEMMMCSDCHMPHELEMGQLPGCDSCHDDGRTAN